MKMHVVISVVFLCLFCRFAQSYESLCGSLSRLFRVRLWIVDKRAFYSSEQVIMEPVSSSLQEERIGDERPYPRQQRS